MNARKAGEFTAITGSGETIQIASFKKVRHEYDHKNGFYEIEDQHEYLQDEFGRPVHCIEKGNYQIIDGLHLIDAVSHDPKAL